MMILAYLSMRQGEKETEKNVHVVPHLRRESGIIVIPLFCRIVMTGIAIVRFVDVRTSCSSMKIQISNEQLSVLSFRLSCGSECGSCFRVAELQISASVDARNIHHYNHDATLAGNEYFFRLSTSRVYRLTSTFDDWGAG